MHSPGSDGSLLDRARDIADRVLVPAAQHVDRSTRVPQSHLDELSAAGLFGLAAPGPDDGPAPTESRRILAAIAGGCGATFFVWAQHHGVVRTLSQSTNRALVERFLPDMCAGTSIAGVAFAHLRRTGPAAIRAERVGDGWTLSGVAPWATSWGIADRFAVAAVTDDGAVVWALLPGVESSDGTYQVRALSLPVLSATGTVAISFDHHRVDDENIIVLDDHARWKREDRIRAAHGQTGVLGVAQRAVRHLDEHDDRDAGTAALTLQSEIDERWRVDDRFTVTPPDTETDIAAASDHRARCLDLGRRATSALLAASGGGGMDLAHPAQRLAREADFYVIQAQTADGRAAVLRAQRDWSEQVPTDQAIR